MTSSKFEIRIDHSFEDTMRLCASAKRPGQESTWIEDEMIKDYSALHHIGIAHSIEAFIKNEKVGGLYGLAIGKMFFGESMFHRVTEASKVCLAKLINISTEFGIELIDCRHTHHT